jgi:hypothetical protein
MASGSEPTKAIPEAGELESPGQSTPPTSAWKASRTNENGPNAQKVNLAGSTKQGSGLTIILIELSAKVTQ